MKRLSIVLLAFVALQDGAEVAQVHAQDEAPLVGVVHTPEGKPHPNAAIYVVYREQRWPRVSGERRSEPTARSDATGKFKVPKLKRETVWVMATADGYCVSDYVRVEPGERARGVTLTLRRGGILVGKIEPAVGEVAGRKIDVMSHNGTLGWREVTTDRLGRFRLEFVIPQHYVIDLDGGWGGVSYRLPVMIRDGETTKVRFGARGKLIKIRGRVRQNGRPGSGIHVGAMLDGSGTGWPDTVTDDSGKFDLHVPEPGLYRFVVGKTNRASMAVYREVADRDIVDLLFELGSGSIRGSIQFTEDKRRFVGVTLVRVTKPKEKSDLWSRYWEMYADRGDFEFELLPAGRYEIRTPDRLISDGGWRPTLGRVVRPGIEVRDGRTTSVDLRLSPGGSITGTIDGAGGESVAGSEVRVQSVDGVSQSVHRDTHVDSGGRFRVRGLAPGTYRVLVRYGGKEFRSPDVTVKARATASTQIQVR